MNKKLFLGIGIAVLCIASVLALGYQLVTTKQSVEVLEGIEMQYWNGAGWTNIPTSTGTEQILPTVTLKPGECGVTYYQVRNIANGGIINLNYLMVQVPSVETTVECHPTMREGIIFSFEEELDAPYIENSLDIQLFGDSIWKTIGIRQCLDGASTLETKEIIGTASRSNGLNVYRRDCNPIVGK